MPTLETSSLILRDFIADDWQAINTLLCDSEATRYMHFAHWTQEQRQEWFAWCLANNHEPVRDVYNWAMTRKDTDTVIGWFGIGSSSHPAVAGERDFGYLLARQHWGHGYMTETLRAIISYEFEELATPHLSATCEINNPASARVMEKAGMRHVQTIHDTDSEGNWADRHHYAIDRNEYQSARR